MGISAHEQLSVKRGIWNLLKSPGIEAQTTGKTVFRGRLHLFLLSGVFLNYEINEVESCLLDQLLSTQIVQETTGLKTCKCAYILKYFFKKQSYWEMSAIDLSAFHEFTLNPVWVLFLSWKQE